jgi:hypothetical protein
MTVDELVELAEHVIGTVTVREAIAFYDDLEDEHLALLVRFVAGERPTAPSRFAGPAPSAEQLAKLEGLDDDGPPSRVDLGDVSLFG